MRIGPIQVDAVLDEYRRPLRSGMRPVRGPIDGPPPGPAESDAAWAGYEQYLGDQGALEIAVACFLIRQADRVVLIDTGNGTGLGDPASVPNDGRGLLLHSLEQLGVLPEQVTDVVFTHLHHDHVGGSSLAGAITFPKATVRCDRRDWDHFVGPLERGDPHDARVTDKVLPLIGRLETFDGQTQLLPGVDTMLTPGHTPGSTSIVVSAGTERLILLGDVVHCPVELLDDDWQGIADVDPALAMATRAKVALEIEQTEAHVAAAHFPELEFGRLLRGEGKRLWVVEEAIGQ